RDDIVMAAEIKSSIFPPAGERQNAVPMTLRFEPKFGQPPAKKLDRLFVKCSWRIFRGNRDQLACEVENCVLALVKSVFDFRNHRWFTRGGALLGGGKPGRYRASSSSLNSDRAKASA